MGSNFGDVFGAATGVPGVTEGAAIGVPGASEGAATGVPGATEGRALPDGGTDGEETL